MTRSRLLVTGATGFIGCALIPRLLQRYDVTLLLLESFADRTPLPPVLKMLRREFDVAYADLRNYRTTVRAVQQAEPEQVIHLAAMGTSDPFLNPHTAVSHNVTGTINLLRACFETGQAIRQLIVARTPGEYSAMNPYAASKAAAWVFCDMYARTAGWPVQGAMIFQAYGPGQPESMLVPAALRAALAGEDFPMTQGHQAKDWIYIDDVVEGFVHILDQPPRPGTTLELGTGVMTSVRDVVDEIYKQVGRGGSPRYGALPSRPGEEIHQVANPTLLREWTGWHPTTSLYEGIASLVSGIINSD